jgi:hypothetical protein
MPQLQPDHSTLPDLRDCADQPPDSGCAPEFPYLTQERKEVHFAATFGRKADSDISFGGRLGNFVRL